MRVALGGIHTVKELFGNYANQHMKLYTDNVRDVFGKLEC